MLLMVATLLPAASTLAQPSDSTVQSIEDRYQQVIQGGSTWERYKVIPITETVQFGEQLADTMAQSRQATAALRRQLADGKGERDSLVATITELQQSLEKTAQERDSIQFLGGNLSKGFYHTVVWSLIAGCAALAIFCYLLYLRSNRLTIHVRKELDTMRREYDAHREKSREIQVKLKRDLQTAVNTLEELRRNGRR